MRFAVLFILFVLSIAPFGLILNFISYTFIADIADYFDKEKIMVEQQLNNKIQEEFAPHFLQIENESHMHSSGKGANSHFRIVLVTDKFVGMRKVARHQLLYQLLAQELQNGIHALALHLYTPTEWLQLNQQAPLSPNCMGVGQ